MNPSGAPQNISSPEQLVAALGSLPPMAQVLARLQSLLADPNSDLGDIAALIRLDAAMTTRVIRISNSAWFSRGEPCRTIDESVNRVGFREVFQVVAIAASGSLVAQPLTAYGWGAIRAWRESAACALAGELIAEGLGDDPAASFMNGLLHAIGRQAVNRYAVAAGKSLADQGFPLDFSGAEFALLGFTQASAGACMLKKWNFSRENSEPVRNQYEPLAAAEPFDRLGAILYGARLLGTTACSGVMPPDSPDEGEIFASLHTSRDAVLSHLATFKSGWTAPSKWSGSSQTRRRGVSRCGRAAHRPSLPHDKSTWLGMVAVLMVGLVARTVAADADVAALKTEITKNHAGAVTRLQDWIRRPSIAAEARGFPEGADYLIALLKEVGFQHAVRIETEGKPGVFATLDAGARKSVGVYFMYDVKQFDPKEWSSPPLEAALVDRPGVGKVVVGRGAVNQKGPESAFLAALDAFRTSGRKLPVNLVLVAEGEEEIASPHVGQIVHRPEVQAALAKCIGVFLPHATQGLDGAVTVNLGAKGVVECELTADALTWGRGPMRDTHSSFKAMVDSPVWRLVQALSTLVTPDGNTPAIDGYMENVPPLSAEDKAMIASASKRITEMQYKVASGAVKWIDDLPFLAALERLEAMPTVNIEGIYGGYTGPGGKTVLPHKATAKLDLRLVPGQTAAEALAKLKAHLAKRGYGDIEVNMTGGYDPTRTPADAPLIQAQVSVLKRVGIDPVLWPWLAGSYPGYVFTDAPLKLAAGHFGLGYGSGAHAPNEFFVIESANPKVQGYDGATLSYVEYLYELAK